jgi:hypothetical protein
MGSNGRVGSSARAADEPGSHLSERRVTKLRIPNDSFCTRGVRDSTSFGFENIACTVTYKVVAYNYRVGERCAPAETE